MGFPDLWKVVNNETTKGHTSLDLEGGSELKFPKSLCFVFAMCHPAPVFNYSHANLTFSLLDATSLRLGHYVN